MMREMEKRMQGYRFLRMGVSFFLCLFFLCVMLLGPGSAVTAFGAETPAEQRVFDGADLWDADETAWFEETIAALEEELSLDVVVVSTADTEGKDGQVYADDFYEEGGFGQGQDRSGILFLIDMEHRELLLSTEGQGRRIFTDDRLESILDDVYAEAAEGDYTACVEIFLDDAEYYGEDGIVSNQYNYESETGKVSRYRSIRWYEALLALAVSVFAAGAACLSVKRRYAMEESEEDLQRFNQAYRAESRFALHSETDQLLHKHVATRVIPKPSSQNRSGSSSSGHSRSSSSGRSTTHRSGSGRSHGGARRKF